MDENKKEAVTEIKKRLEILGINEIDETVIDEILQSCNSSNKVEYVVEMITGTSNSDLIITDDVNQTRSVQNFSKNNDLLKSKRQTNSDAANGAIKKSNDSKQHTFKVAWDSEEEDDNYGFLPWNDNVENPVQYVDPFSVRSNGNTSSSLSIVNNPFDEIIEENNNDPNNNLNAAEILQESGYNMSDLDMLELKSMQSVDLSKNMESSKSGCSKDLYNAPPLTKLKEEALQIQRLLHRFKFHIIFAVLYKNRYAKNRVELTLWDLLPEKRPEPEVPFKRKNSDDICTTECKKTPVPGEQCQQKPYRQRQKGNKHDRKWNHGMGMPFNAIQHQKGGKGKNKYHNNSMQMQQNGLQNSSPMQNNILRPAKLLVDSPIPKQNRMDILAPPKLFYMQTKHNTDAYHWKKKNYDASLSNFCNKMGINAGQEKSNMYNDDAWINTYKQDTIKKISKTDQKKHPGNNMSKRNIAMASFLAVQEADSATELLDSFKAHKNLGKPQKRNNAQIRNSLSKKGFQTQVDEAALNLDIFLDHADSEDIIKNIQGIHSTISNSESVKKAGKISEENERESDKIYPDMISLDIFLDHPDSEAMIKNLQSNRKAADSDTKLKETDEERKKQVKQEHINDEVAAASSIINLTASDPNNIHNGTSTNNTAKSQLQDLKNDLLMPSTSYENNDDIKDEEMEVEEEQIEEALPPKIFKIYYKLVSMFPSVSSKYIRRICMNLNIGDGDGDGDEVPDLYTLIEHLLAYGYQYPRDIKIKDFEETSYDVNEQYTNLLGIFPDADPTYLRQIAIEHYNNPDAMKEFVQSKLELRDYPTREQYLAKQKITEQQKQYTVDFDIKRFLDIFSDPFTHFANPKRVCGFNTEAFDFLKHRYNRLKVNTIMNIYQDCKYNVTLAAERIQNTPSDMKTKRVSPPMVTTENIPLLQEFAFIEHKEDIRYYVAELKKREEREFNELKESGGLLECQCCYDNECMPTKCSTCDNGHIFCNRCILKGTETKLGDGQTRVQCFENCGGEFSLSVLQHVLPPTQFSILLQKKQEAEIMAAGVEGLVTCPFCHFASIPPPEDKVFKCLNPECMKESCRLCKELNHVPQKCDELKSTSRHYLEEKMTEALLRKCYKCGKPFFKEEGCNLMRCVCGANMCYICDKPVNGYNHFNGQGSARTDLCPLWSDNGYLNAQAVKTVAEATVKELQQKNPHIKLDTRGLMPDVPTTTRGPHNDIPNANAIPERVARLIGNNI